MNPRSVSIILVLSENLRKKTLHRGPWKLPEIVVHSVSLISNHIPHTNPEKHERKTNLIAFIEPNVPSKVYHKPRLHRFESYADGEPMPMRTTTKDHSRNTNAYISQTPHRERVDHFSFFLEAPLTFAVPRSVFCLFLRCLPV